MKLVWERVRKKSSAFVEMALVNAWKTDVTANPSLLASVVEYGLQKLGYERIKPEQLTAIQSLLKGINVFMSVPTGFGKSLVYQLLPFCAERLLHSSSWEFKTPVVVIVSPLVSLMHDQVSKLAAKGVNAVCISGDVDLDDAYALVTEGRFTHVFGSPEAFVGSRKWRSLFLDKSFSGRVTAIAIDEAHCIVKW